MRWVICALLFLAFTANYVDRSVFGNLAPEMPKYLHLDARVSSAEAGQYWIQHAAELSKKFPAQLQTVRDLNSCMECQQVVREEVAKKNWSANYWEIQMVFSFVFALSTMFMGRLVDVIGLRLGFAIVCGVWALGSALQSVAPEIGNLFGNPVAGFFICVALLSLGQGGIMPSAIKAAAEWFPKRERALSTGIFNSGSNFGGLVTPWVLPALLAALTTVTIGSTVVGWRGAFVPGVIIDLVFIVAWVCLYRKPAEHPLVSQAELDIILSDSAVAESTVKVPWRKLLYYRQTWAIVAAKLLTDGFWSFYLFSAPDFFHRKFGLAPNDRKFLIMIIYVLSALGSTFGGWLAGRFMQLGWSVNRSRKTTLLICALCVVPVFYAALTQHQWVAALLIMIAASGHQAWVANTGSLVGDMFPKRVVGSLMGFSGMFGAFGMMTLFYITARVLSVTGNYLPVFILASCCYLFSVLLVHLIVPDLEPTEGYEEKTLLKHADYETKDECMDALRDVTPTPSGSNS
jgi:ACS family hexuronate transporter-like MFS transporter